MTLKIAITGVHGIGKSTIIQNLIKNMDKLKEFGFEIIKSYEEWGNPPFKLGGTFEGQIWIMNQNIKRNKEVKNFLEENKNKNALLLFDRTPIDAFLYSKYFFGDTPVYHIIEEMYNLQEWMDYDLLFLLTASTTAVQKRIIDRNRATIKEWKEAETNYIEGILNLFYEHFKDKKNVYVINTENKSAEETTNEILNVIKSKLTT